MARRGPPLVDVLLWIGAFGIAAAAAYLMLVPTPPGAQTIPPLVAHFLLYFLQTVVTLMAAVGSGVRPAAVARPAWWVTAAVVAYATGLELGQSAVPDRETEVADLLANAAGAGSGLAAWHLLRARLTSR